MNSLSQDETASRKQPRPSRLVRVMIVVGSLEVGGAQKHIFDLVRQLDRSRFDISIVSSQAGGYYYDRIRDLGVPVRDLEVQNRWHLLLRLPRFLRYIREVDPDVLHLFLYYPSLFGCLLRLLPQRRAPRVIVSKRSLNLSLRPDRHAVYRYILMRVPDAITAVSESVRRRCLELGASPGKVRVIENAIEPIDLAEAGKLRRVLGVGDDTLLVGAVGSLTVRKGHRHLLNAMPSLLAELPDVHAVLIGEGNLRSELEAESRRLRIEHRVHLPGTLVPAVSYITDLSLFVLPSAEEGMSNALLEAMMVGVPCIASDIPSNREVITNGRDGILVDVEDPRALADAMRVLLAGPDRRHSMSAQARETIRRRFNPRTMIQANEDLYIALARQRG